MCARRCQRGSARAVRHCRSGAHGLEGQTMTQELDPIVLTRDRPEYGLKKGDVGAVVHCYADGATMELSSSPQEAKQWRS